MALLPVLRARPISTVSFRSSIAFLKAVAEVLPGPPAAPLLAAAAVAGAVARPDPTPST